MLRAKLSKINRRSPENCCQLALSIECPPPLPAIRGSFVSFPPANPEKPQIIDTILKRLCVILHRLKYAFQTHSRDSFTH